MSWQNNLCKDCTQDCFFFWKWRSKIGELTEDLWSHKPLFFTLKSFLYSSKSVAGVVFYPAG